MAEVLIFFSFFEYFLACKEIIVAGKLKVKKSKK